MAFLLAIYLASLSHLVHGEGQFGSIAASGGYEPQLVDSPWATGVHRRNTDGVFKHICGGSLITEQIVISAAHCFWDSGPDVPLDEYRITAGNFNREIQHFNIYMQIMKLKQVIFHERYRGYDLNFAHDIVIVVLTENVNVTKNAAPIAVDWSSSFEDFHLKGQFGTVIGWGFTELDKQSVGRVAVNLPFVDFDNCFKVVPREFRSSLTPDKFCAGLTNGTAVCPGDSGGGLAFKSTQDDKWYLRGIVSVGVKPNDKSKCHKSQYTAFTSISQYRTWLLQKLRDLHSQKYQQSTTEVEDEDELIFSS